MEFLAIVRTDFLGVRSCAIIYNVEYGVLLSALIFRFHLTTKTNVVFKKLNPTCSFQSEFKDNYPVSAGKKAHWTLTCLVCCVFWVCTAREYESSLFLFLFLFTVSFVLVVLWFSWDDVLNCLSTKCAKLPSSLLRHHDRISNFLQFRTPAIPNYC